MEIGLLCPCCGGNVGPDHRAFLGLLVNLRRSLAGDRVSLEEQIQRVEKQKKKGWVLVLTELKKRLEKTNSRLQMLPIDEFTHEREEGKS